MTSDYPGPHDAVLEDRAREFVDSLTPRLYERAMAGVRDLMNDPHPDERVKIRLPFPFLYGTIGYHCDGFFNYLRVRERGDAPHLYDFLGHRLLLRLARSA